MENDQYNFFQSIMSHHAKMFKKKLCDRSWDIRLNNFGPNWAQILLLLEKGIFWENWLTPLFSTHYASLSQKNTGRSCDIRCWSFGPNWTQITHLPLQGKFLSTSDTPSQYYNVLKKIIKVDHKIQGCIIFGQIGQRHFFRGKLTIVTFVNLLCPIILKCLN